MTPEEALCLANKAGVRRLVLTHFGCTRYTSNEERLKLLNFSEKLSGELLIAHDGMILVL